MLSRKAIAYNVNNLTDARYFAAWGVSYIAFGYDPALDIEQQITVYKEIKNWCEGIDFLIQYELEDHKEAIAHIYAQLGLSGVIQSPFVRSDFQEGILFRKIEDLSRIHAEENLVLTSSDIDESKILETTKANQVYMPITEDNIQFLHTHDNIGLLLQGSPEEKVGYKSYDELDELLDKLVD